MEAAGLPGIITAERKNGQVKPNCAKESVTPDRLSSILEGKPLRFLEYGLVGGTGMLVDLAAVWALLELQVHYLVAQVGAFSLALTWNFLLNHHWTFGSPDGSLLHHYIEYVAVQLAAFGVRIVTVFALVDVMSVGVIAASTAGILLPAVLGFLEIEKLFGMEERGES